MHSRFRLIPRNEHTRAVRTEHAARGLLQIRVRLIAARSDYIFRIAAQIIAGKGERRAARTARFRPQRYAVIRESRNRAGRANPRVVVQTLRRLGNAAERLNFRGDLSGKFVRDDDFHSIKRFEQHAL